MYDTNDNEINHLRQFYSNEKSLSSVGNVAKCLKDF